MRTVLRLSLLVVAAASAGAFAFEPAGGRAPPHPRRSSTHPDGPLAPPAVEDATRKADARAAAQAPAPARDAREPAGRAPLPNPSISGWVVDSSGTPVTEYRIMPRAVVKYRNVGGADLGPGCTFTFHVSRGNLRELLGPGPLPGGETLFFVWAPGFASGSFRASTCDLAELMQGRSLVDVGLVLRREVRISGRVLGPGSEPVSSGEVLVVGDPFGWRRNLLPDPPGFTDGGGRYLVEGLDPVAAEGLWAVARMNGGELQSEPVPLAGRIREGETTELDLGLVRRSRVALEIRFSVSRGRTEFELDSRNHAAEEPVVTLTTWSGPHRILMQPRPGERVDVPFCIPEGVESYSIRVP